MTSDAASSAGVSAAPVASRLAEKRRLLEGLSSSSKRVPHPVVSTWGLANLEISVPIGSFPVDGAEETFVDGRIDAVVGGVAANVSRALGRLGVRVHAHLVVGADGLGAQVRSQLDGWEGVEATVIPTPECPRTVVLYADDGQRHILMDPRAATSTDFPAAALDTIGRSQLAHVTLADIGRPVLHAASAAGVPVAVDLQAVTDIDSARVRTFAGAASVLFLSGAGLASGQRLDTLRAIAGRFDIPIAVMGMGSAGAAMTADAGESVITTPAHSPRPVRSTLGAGDALAAGFLASLAQGMDPSRCLRRAVLFAGHKVGSVGGTRGFLDAAELSRLEADAGRQPAMRQGSAQPGPVRPTE